MEYNWSIDKIRNLKYKTRELLLHKKDLTKEEKQTLKNIIETLTDMENSLLPNNFNFSFPRRIKYMDSNRLLPRDTYLTYNDVPHFLKETILTASCCFQDYLDTFSEIELPKLNLSNQELVELSHDFFEWLPNKKYLKAFEFYTNPNKNLLRFTHNQCDVLVGQTNFFYYPTYRPYFSIDKSNDINDFISLNHEIIHGIMNKYDNTYSFKGQHYFLMELEGAFFDFLSIQYLKRFMSHDIINQLEYTRFITVYDDFVAFYVIDSAIKLFEKDKKISIIPIQKRILKQDLHFPIDETILLKSLQTDPKISAKYLISYLTTLDLQNIYENDPEYAFYLFEKIRNNKSNNIFKNLEDNKISFVGENENYILLQKTIKKMNQLGK